MPFILSPSRNSVKRWGGLSQWPLHLNLAILGTSFALLLVSLAASVQLAEAITWTGISGDNAWRYGWASQLEIEAILPPLCAMAIALVNLTLHSTRTLSPAAALSVSVIVFSGWLCTIFWWYIGFFWRTYGYMDWQTSRSLGIAMLFGASLEALLNLVYLVYASIAVHRVRKYGLGAPSSGENTRLPSEHELGSRRASPATSASTVAISGQRRTEEAEIV